MKADWDARARSNARYFIATTEFESEEVFDASGRRDAALFFAGLESLLHARATVLDVGCGIGRMDRFLAPRLGRLIGLDVSGEMIALARERLADLPNVELVEGEGYGLGVVEDSSVDLVYSFIVFHHVPRAVFHGYLPEVMRVLKPGGSFVFQLPEARGWTPSEPPDEDSFELRFYEEREVRARLERAGFEWLECRRFPIGGNYPVDYLRLHARHPRDEG